MAALAGLDQAARVDGSSSRLPEASQRLYKNWSVLTWQDEKKAGIIDDPGVRDRLIRKLEIIAGRLKEGHKTV